jgi:tight adherence protein C
MNAGSGVAIIVLIAAWWFRPSQRTALGTMPQVDTNDVERSGHTRRLVAWMIRGEPSEVTASMTRLTNRSLLLIVVATIVSVPSAGVLIMMLLIGLRRIVRNERLKFSQGVHDDMIAVTELLIITATSGLTLRDGILLACGPGHRVTGPLGHELHAAAIAIERGQRLVRGLQRLSHDLQLGEVARPLLTALAMSEEFGTPIAPSLAALRHELRDIERRTAEEVARKVPVRMLAPLMIFLLPSFALLCIGPLLVSGLHGLRL